MRTGHYSRGLTLVEILVSIGIIILLGAMLFPVISAIREKGRQITCQNNQRQIAITLIMYAQDNYDTLPPADMVWNTVDLPAKMLVCPDKPSARNGYVFNGLLAGQRITGQTSMNTMLTADGNAADNIATAPSDLDARHGNKLIASFADGHVALLSASSLPGDQ